MRSIISVAVCILSLVAVPCFATDVYLHTTIDDSTQTWRVTATTGDNKTLGIAAFSIDITSSGVGISKLPSPGDTLVVPISPFSFLRSSGKQQSGNRISEIFASQEVIPASENGNDSFLGYGYGVVGTAFGVTKGPIVGLGEFVIAEGRYDTPTGPFSITGMVSPGGFFNLFPLNYNPNLPRAKNGPSHAAPLAGKVFSSTVNWDPPAIAVPEPTGAGLLMLGGILLLAFSPRRSPRTI